MPGKVEIRVDGLRQLEAAMKELGVQASNRIARSALNRSATVVVKRARELAPQPGASDDPYATGELRKAIGKRLRRQKRGSDVQTILIGVEKPTSRRAHFVEFGSAHQAAEPFLRPALDEKAQEVLQIQAQALRDGIERETRKLAQKHQTRKR